MPDQELAADLDRLRRTAGLTLRDLGKMSGVPRSTLSDALSGRRAPRLDTVVAIARACGSDVDTWRQRWAAATAVRSEGRIVERFVGDAIEFRRLGVGWQIQQAAVARAALSASDAARPSRLAVAARQRTGVSSDICAEHLIAEALALVEQVRLAGDHGVGGGAITLVALVEFAPGDAARAAAIEARAGAEEERLA